MGTEPEDSTPLDTGHELRCPVYCIGF